MVASVTQRQLSAGGAVGRAVPARLARCGVPRGGAGGAPRWRRSTTPLHPAGLCEPAGGVRIAAAGTSARECRIRQVPGGVRAGRHRYHRFLLAPVSLGSVASADGALAPFERDAASTLAHGAAASRAAPAVRGARRARLAPVAVLAAVLRPGVRPAHLARSGAPLPGRCGGAGTGPVRGHRRHRGQRDAATTIYAPRISDGVED
eukprot:ctg_1028.g425